MGLNCEQDVDSNNSGERQRIKVSIDINRSDIMHPCDVAEDLAIAFNYNKLIEKSTPTPTIGS